MATVRSSTSSAAVGMVDRVPPQSIEAEKGVLGSVLLDSRVLDDVVPIVRPEHFYRDAHQKVFRSLLEMYETGASGIDTLTLTERLRNAGVIDDIGGAAYLGELLSAPPHAGNAAYYARIVRDKALLRELIHTSHEVLRDAYDEQQAPEQLLAEAERRIFRILEDRGGTETMQISDILHAAFDRIDQRLKRGAGMISGLPTGFIELDHLTSGLQDSELLILAARPSVGKTALAVNIAEHAAVEENAPCLVVSLEQSRLELAERLLCSRAKVDGHRLRNGQLRREDHQKLGEASGILSQAQLFIDDAPGRDILQIAAIARRLKRRHNLRLVVIDYLQLIDPDDQRNPRQEQIALIARRLKHMARELAIPVMVLAQLNRAVEMREGHRPRLSDLRESGAIEQDADVVMLLHRDDAYNPEDNPGVAEVIIAKQRNGPTGSVKLAFLKQYTRFENLSHEVEAGPAYRAYDEAAAERPF